MVYSKYSKLRILHLHEQGYRLPTIHKLLKEEGIKATREGMAKFLKRFYTTVKGQTLIYLYNNVSYIIMFPK